MEWGGGLFALGEGEARAKQERWGARGGWRVAGGGKREAGGGKREAGSDRWQGRRGGILRGVHGGRRRRCHHVYAHVIHVCKLQRLHLV